MTWIRPIILILIALRSLAVLFSCDDDGQEEFIHLLHFSDSNDRAIIKAATPAECIWQLIGVALVYELHLSLWHFLWWIPFGFVVILVTGKLLLLRNRP